MLRRVIGLLMILAILFPLVAGVVGVVVASDIVGRAQADWNIRRERIQARMDAVETTINTVSARFEALRVVSDQISATANETAQTVVNTINTFNIIYAGFQWPPAIKNALAVLGITLPDIPPASLAIPGLSAVRDFLQSRLMKGGNPCWRPSKVDYA